MRVAHALPPLNTQAVDTAVISVVQKAALREQLSALQKRVADANKAAAAANKVRGHGGAAAGRVRGRHSHFGLRLPWQSTPLPTVVVNARGLEC